MGNAFIYITISVIALVVDLRNILCFPLSKNIAFSSVMSSSKFAQYLHFDF